MLTAQKLEEVVYGRREPEEGLLHLAVADNLETFLAGLAEIGHELSRHVEKELREFVGCGVLGNGFVRLRCDDCGEKERVVAFSCKGRGFCPSCTGRRMADTSARLVDDVFPREAPVRQWVLSLPLEIRYRLAHDGDLLSDVLGLFLRVVRRWYRERGRELGLAECRGGSVTFAQRFGSALNLNPHFHALALDGVFNARNNFFHPAPELTDDDVKRIVKTVASRVLRLLERRGALDPDSLDPLCDDSPVLAGISAASVRGLVATGDRAGRVVRRVLTDPAEPVRTGPLCFASRGFSLHAATRIEAGDRAGLERLCRYVARPPLATGRLARIDDERLSFQLKTPWEDGTTHLILSPLELIEKLAALVPPPRINLVRYHGVLAAHAKDRDKIVPKKPDAEKLRETRGASRNRLLWAALLARVFAIDVTKCPKCGGRLRLVAAVTDAASAKRYLDGVGLPSAVPELAPARAPPQMKFDW
ncbi:MAG: hypothetical protein A2496_08820 [Burkholderiales bacterium RIFOXYC12_FULL_60_6]|nr:MAG: hypothetical protein A2496_08820 [Burkholderiales bacterium RIFOXYC12_FULL_60_6]